MSQLTAIEWCDISWNPVHGCSKVSPGCAHCYAETLSRRYKQTLKPWTPANATENVILKPHKLGEPLSNRKEWRGLGAAAAAAGKTDGKLVFVNSTSDLFHEEVPDEFIAEVFAVMAHTPQHTYQVLTKRPARMQSLLSRVDFPHMVARAWDRLTVRWKVEKMRAERSAAIEGFPGYLVTDRGRVLRVGCSDRCVYCDDPLPGDRMARSKFCSQRCNSKAHYEQTQGRWSAPNDVAREMSPEVGEQGHLRVQLIAPDGTPRRFGVHRLVLAAFDRAPLEDEQGCHRDGDPANNALPNLRWGTQSENWGDRIRHGNHRTHRVRERASTWIEPDLGFEWPLPNCWAGVSIENRRFVHRADVLRETPAAVRFISAEPLLGPLIRPDRWVDQFDTGSMEHREWEDGSDILPELDLTGIDWLIVGGESGPGHRPMRKEWVCDLRDACVATPAPESACDCLVPALEGVGNHSGSCGCLGQHGTAFFFKQWGGSSSKAGGRELDGRLWSEFPAVAA